MATIETRTAITVHVLLTPKEAEYIKELLQNAYMHNCDPELEPHDESIMRAELFKALKDAGVK